MNITPKVEQKVTGVTFELSVDEAYMLATIMGSIAGEGQLRNFATDIFYKIDGVFRAENSIASDPKLMEYEKQIQGRMLLKNK